jgi:aldose 1-epimerase
VVKEWGRIDGEIVNLFTIENEWGKVSFSEYGAAITELFIKDKNGVLKNVVLGYDNLEGYIGGTSFQGATIGRFANRIKGGFTLGGVYYPLECNDGDKNLHGHPGFDKKLWKGEPGGIGGGESNSVTFKRISPDGESGFPGNLEVSVTFTFENNALKIHYLAKTDKDTHVSLTNHSYFNLSGDPAKKITDTDFSINGEKYVPGDLPKGYDDNFFLSKTDERIMKTVAVAENGESGIKMSVITDMPAIQFYNCANLDDTFRGIKCGLFSAFCLETQFAPDTPNRPDYPSSLLKAGEIYDRTTIYQFQNI